MPYAVSMASNAGSAARNLRRMRLTWEVTVPSSTTRFASRMSCSRLFTCSGNLARAWTIQNSVSVSGTVVPRHATLKGLRSSMNGQRLGGRGGREHLEPVLAQRVRVVRPDGRIVLDDGDSASHGGRI